MENGGVRLMRFVEVIQKTQIVQIVKKDGMFLISPRCDMIESTLVFNPDLSGHMSKDRNAGPFFSWLDPRLNCTL